jgi:predicted DNA binding CopG/RHH family protein
MNKPFPNATTDQELETLLEGDLSSHLTPKNLKPMPFERQAKAVTSSQSEPKSF